MRIREIFDILKNTELKQIVVGNDDDYVLGVLNQALIEVYGRFNILQEEQTIYCEEGRTRYRLVENAQRVLQVFMRDTKKDPLNGEDDFLEVPINDINCDESVFTPQPNLLHIPNPSKGKLYSVIYTVTPPYITKDNMDKVDIIVPPQYLPPILNYAAYRAYKSMNGDEQSEIGSHWRAYQESVREIYKTGMYQYSILTNVKADERGFK